MRTTHWVWLLVGVGCAVCAAEDGGAALAIGSFGGKMDVQDDTDGVTVDTGAMQFRLDAQRYGGLVWVRSGDKDLVRAADTPLLFGSLFESKTYDGHSDYVADGAILPGTYRLVGFEHKRDGGSFAATTRAELSWAGTDRIVADIEWRAIAGSPHMSVTVSFRPEGRFRGRFLRELGLQFPLALNMRKRIVQGGDQGWQFNVRHYYQFHLGTTMRLMTEPEHNWWRHFMVEQDSPTHFSVWRAESEATPALRMQHGQHAPGWMSAYDQQGGVLWAYRNMHERAPKGVAMDAADAGTARILFHPPTARAIAVNAPAAQAVVFCEHRTDWVWYDGEFIFAKPERVLKEVWNEEQLASDPPARPRVIDTRFPPAPEATVARVPLVSGGLPLPRGAIDRPDQVRVFRADKEVPLQTKPLAFWPDGSVKWLLLTFPLDGDGSLTCEPGSGTGEAVDFNVTLRGERSERFRLLYGKQVRTGSVTSPLFARQEGDEITIDTGPLCLTLGAGRNWLRQVLFRGVQQFREDGESPLAAVDFLRTDGVYPVNTTHPQGHGDPGPVDIESVELEENGPLRATVRLQGYARSIEPARVILRVEASAVRSTLRIFHSVEFLHKDPREAFVRSMDLSLPLTTTRRGSRLVAGAQHAPVEVPDILRTGLAQYSHGGYTLWQQAEGQPFTNPIEQNERSRGWLSWADGRSGCMAVVRNMWQEYPKEIVVEPRQQTLRIGLWPASHPLMDVRRYSDYPHRSQGESTSADSDWVDKVYYPNDPFVGVSKTHELLLFFHDTTTGPDQLDAVAADFQEPPLVYVTPEWYASVGITFPYPAPDTERFPNMEKNLTNVTDFWLFHQKIWAWYGMFDYGDVMHMFGPGGYGWTLAPEDLIEALKVPEQERYTVNYGSKRQPDYVAVQDWCFDNGRWGWGNTEGNPGLFLQMQYLRSGRRDWFFAAEAMARHTRDVDMRHDGKWFGKGTRHGVQHWSCGNHEERQTVHSEWRFHHYLTGDMRSRDFARRLTEEYYTQTHISSHAAHSGRLYGLLTRWEMTGEDALGELLRKYVHCFIVPEGIDVSAPVKFPGAERMGPPADPNSASMFFHSFGAMHALLEYYELTGDPELKAALIRMAASAVEQKSTSYVWRKPWTFAALHAKDPAPFAEMLAPWKSGASSSHAYYLFNMVSDNRRHWSGETAYLRPGVSGQWFWLNDVLYLMSWMDREPEMVAEHAESFEELNRSGQRRSLNLGAWQAGYGDIPELADYLRDRRQERLKTTR